MELLTYNHYGTSLVLRKEEKKVEFVGLYPVGLASRAVERRGGSPLQMQVTGENRPGHHGVRSIGSLPGERMQLVCIAEDDWEEGHLIVVILKDWKTGLLAEVNYLLCEGSPTIRSWVRVRNDGRETVGLEWVYSVVVHNLAVDGLKPWWEKCYIYLCYNNWYGEGQWRKYQLPEMGLTRSAPQGIAAVQVTNLGSWSTHKALPLGILEDSETGTAWYWQIEHSGSWHWEVGEDDRGQLYLLAGGPDELHHGWWKRLEPGHVFETVPVAFGCADGGWEGAIAALTRYRRETLLPAHPADSRLPVIFNDYMNCLMGDPTTEKLLPLIDAAARAGAEYFVIDAGWYADIGANWWDTVGTWEPSTSRFPRGIEEPINAIKEKGMIPGLWLEIEVAGVNGPLARKPDSWFFMRHGRRVIDHGRCFLDFRNPEVIEYVNSVIDRLVGSYGIGYIKMDYNVNATLGTETDADSFADGLLQHTRALYSWLDDLHRRYPDLIIENCSSGGNRMDYGLLSRTQLQSSSDQTDYRLYPSILAGAVAGCLPEQLAVWSYPMRGGDAEETAFNMANALLLRIHQSGHLAELSPEQFAVVSEGIRCYKSIRSDIRRFIPFWPLGFLPLQKNDTWYSYGMRVDGESRLYLVVWRLSASESTFSIPIKFLQEAGAEVELLFPKSLPVEYEWCDVSGVLSVQLPRMNTARVFKVEW